MPTSTVATPLPRWVINVDFAILLKADIRPRRLSGAVGQYATCLYERWQRRNVKAHWHNSGLEVSCCCKSTPNGALVMPKPRKHSSFDVMGLLTQHNTRWTSSNYQEDQIVYAQGDPADSVFYIHRGKVKVTVISKLGKEAVVAIRGPDEFCGEDALTGTPLWLTTTTTMSTCEIIRLETKTVVRLLHENQEFADYFLAHLLTRTARVEADLVDQLFNSSEMRLARALLLLANYGNDFGLEPIAIKVNQETLASLIGTTRSRVNVFMNKFRKLGLINYNGKLEVQKGLLNFVLNERPHIEP
jgi:CRP/FNR family cyclic AMP-dependent transcriptional regulator